MEALNNSLFLWMNAPAHPDPWILGLALVFAKWLIWAVPAGIMIAWLRGNEHIRKAMLAATIAAVLGLLVNQAIGLAWLHPRPFMIGLGHTFMMHAADSSFPSDHLTAWWAVAFSLVAQPKLGRLGVILALFGVPIAWARIYLGVHFPFDMLGAAIVAAFSAWLAVRASPWYMNQAYLFASKIYSRLFRPLIDRGWVRGV